MRIVALLIVVLAVYLYFARQSPVAPVVDEITAKEVAPLTTGPRAGVPKGTSSAARPFQRTDAVLQQVKQRNGDGEF